MVGSEGNMTLKNPVTPPEIDPGTVRLVAQRLNHYATPSPLVVTLLGLNLLNNPLTGRNVCVFNFSIVLYFFYVPHSRRLFQG